MSMSRAEAFDTLRQAITVRPERDANGRKSIVDPAEEAKRLDTMAEAGLVLLEDFFFHLGTCANALQRIAAALEQRA